MSQLCFLNCKLLNPFLAAANFCFIARPNSSSRLPRVLPDGIQLGGSAEQEEVGEDEKKPAQHKGPPPKGSMAPEPNAIVDFSGEKHANATLVPPSVVKFGLN